MGSKHSAKATFSADKVSDITTFTNTTLLSCRRFS